MTQLHIHCYGRHLSRILKDKLFRIQRILSKRLNSRLIELTTAISDLDQKYALNPTPELLKQHIDLQVESDLISTKDAERLPLRSRGSYYEHGDKASRLLAHQLQRQTTFPLIVLKTLRI